MRVAITEHPASWLEHYARVPSSFLVESRLEATPAPEGGFFLVEHPVPESWVKDYDATPGYGPTAWPRNFDLRSWTFFGAEADGRLVGCAAAVRDAPEIWLLAGRRDLGLLWDIRVLEEARGQGVGGALLGHVERWASRNGCSELLIETQDINVSACRFYARQGCSLASVIAGAYPDFPGEAQFLWRKALGT